MNGTKDFLHFTILAHSHSRLSFLKHCAVFRSSLWSERRQRHQGERKTIHCATLPFEQSHGRLAAGAPVRTPSAKSLADDPSSFDRSASPMSEEAHRSLVQPVPQWSVQYIVVNEVSLYQSVCPYSPISHRIYHYFSFTFILNATFIFLPAP